MSVRASRRRAPKSALYFNCAQAAHTDTVSQRVKSLRRRCEHWRKTANSKCATAHCPARALGHSTGADSWPYISFVILRARSDCAPSAARSISATANCSCVSKGPKGVATFSSSGIFEFMMFAREHQRAAPECRSKVANQMDKLEALRGRGSGCQANRGQAARLAK